ncbi:MAG: tRNA (cytidine(34)-2'-O)-methyltransferase [Candidatus Weimeria sp.]
MFHIVLHEPEIPFNTGAIGRTCVATGSSLHLIYPLGFIINDKYVKRAGMDYWPKLDLHEYNDYDDFLVKHREIIYNGEEEASYCEETGPDDLHEKDCVYSNPAEKITRPKLWFATTKARQCYSDVKFGPDDYIMFGKESAGIPEEILVKHPKACIRIPMLGETRSLNLSNSVAIVLYEALRQNDFMGLNEKGNLHRLKWDYQE